MLLSLDLKIIRGHHLFMQQKHSGAKNVYNNVLLNVAT